MPEKTYTILIVEDDPTIASSVQAHLKGWGFDVICADDFFDVLGVYRRVQPDLTLLDISLPRCNGFYWCRQIRMESHAPILFLTSHTESADVIMAMNMGGDDYITKPFSMGVLTAKVQALMRRAYSYDANETPLRARGANLLSGGILQTGGRSIDLTRNENRMLRVLLERKNSIVSRETLMRALWDDDHFIDENTLTVNVNRLRRKLAAEGLEDFILTKKGEGYLVRDETPQ